jgi:hypothetical protein
VVFSQPSGDLGTGSPSSSDSTGATSGASTSTLISLAATLAIRDGNADGIRQMLGADADTVTAFNMALAVQEATGGAEGASRLERRTEEEVEKRRAAKAAAEAMIREEKEELRAANSTDADLFVGVLGAADLDTIPDPDPLITDFLNKETLIRLYGPPKSFKSFVMLDMAACVGAGIEWHGKRTVQAKVLYIIAEGLRGIKRRVRAWEAHNRRPMEGVHFYPRAVQIARPEEMRPLIAFAKRGNYELVIFDTQARCSIGVEENSPTQMGLVTAALDVLKEVTGACVALVHHSGAAGGRARGTTSVLGAVDGEFEVEADKDKSSVTLKTVAQKDLGEHPEITLDLVTPGPGMSLAVKTSGDWYKQRAEDLTPLGTREMQILTALAGYGNIGATMGVLGKTFPNADPLDLRRAASRLESQGCITLKGAAMHVARKGQMHLDRAAAQLPED